MSIYSKLWFAKVPLDINKKLGLLKRNFDLSKIYNYNYKEFLNLGFSIKEADAFESAKNKGYLENTLSYLHNEGIKFVFITDKEYPKALKHIYKPPVGLFIKGNTVDFNNSISIVGARRASVYGKSIAKSLGKDISENGIAVVSGLALGIDAYAHIGAIEGSGLTVGVIGSGLMHTYPKTNQELYSEILKKGCIISEYFPEEKPLKHRFPERNRIISGISKGTVVVEAGEKSGSLITADLAINQGREVYAVPGNINSINSIGCNRLIREGAKIVTCVNDILEDFSLFQTLDLSYKNDLSSEEIKVLDCLKNGDKSFEEMYKMLNMDIGKLLPILSKLECLKTIKKLYGNYYSICQA